MRPWLGFLVLSALLVVGCAPGGISRDRAIELALEGGADSAVPPSVVSVESGPLGRFVGARTLPEEPRERQVWAVLLAGNFEGECVANASGESVCPPGSVGKLVVLDLATGEFLFSESR